VDRTINSHAKKKPAKLTATDQVIRIINRSKEGIDAPILAKKPGVDLKTVRNIHHRVYKKGKVKRAGSEIYVGA